MSKQNKIRESVLLPDEYRDKVIAQSEKEIRSKSSIIAEAVKLYYERKEGQKYGTEHVDVVNI